MDEIAEVLRRHFRKYPRMQAQDAVKLICQNELGAGHLAMGQTGSLAQLEQELAAVEQNPYASLCESIGNGKCRVHLAALGTAGIPAETLQRVFAASAAAIQGSKEVCAEKVERLRSLSARGETPFSFAALDDFLVAFHANGCPLISHSQVYRETYSPAYRVMGERYALFLPLFAAIDARISKGQTIRLGIDGKCGAGKTTLAALLATVYDCSIVHMDHFFLPKSLRTPERLTQPGGNVHHERFEEEAAPGIRNGGGFQYRRFNCAAGEYAEHIEIAPKPLLIVEGSYSLHPRHASLYDQKVFLTLSEEAQKKRIEKRCNGKAYRRFMEEWIPLENRYFEAYSIRQGCDFVFNT